MQLNANDLTSSVAPKSPDFDDAGGVPESHWYVAIVNHNTEKSVAERLGKQGFETYVATQPDYRLRANGKRVIVDRVVIPSTIFIHCTDSERLQALKTPGISRFLTDRGRKQGDAPAPPAIIPPIQLNKLRFMLGQSDAPVGFAPRPMAPGDKVRVIRGSLRGLEGEVISGTGELLVRLDILGSARVTINPHDLEPLAD